MNSILHNSAAMSALQALNMTQQALNTTQNQVSSGLAVASAADNASYWSIAQQLNANSTMVTAANSSISQSQAILDTANTAINSIITTINQIQSALTAAANPGANFGNVNTTLAQYGQQLTDAVNGAYFNGINVLDGSSIAGSVTNNGTTNVNFVSGFYAATPSASPFSVSNSANANTGLTDLSVTTVSMSLTTVYAAASGGAAGSGLLYSTGTYTPPTGSTAATGGTYDLTQLGGSSSNAGATTVSATNVQDILTAVNSALNQVTNYAATIGATKDRMSAMTNLNNALVTNYANGVSGLVDADMNTASTRLQALQTQQQLGIQALSIANQNAQLIMKLFG